MKPMIVNSICFGVGAAAGIIFTSLYWKKKMNDILAEEESYYSRESYPDDFDESGVEVNPTREDGVLSSKQRDEIREKLVRNFEQTSNYATMYNEETEHPVDSDEDEEEIDDSNVETDEERANAEHKENFNKPPKIISAEEFSNLPPYIETGALYFYHYDNVLVDEDDDEIDDPGALIGECLDKYGFRDSDEEMIFVMNYQIDKAFEVHRVMGSWNGGSPMID